LRRAGIAVAVLALSSCGDLDLQGGTLICSADHRCPDGFHCAADDRCWPDGIDPDLAMTSSDGKMAMPDLAARDTAAVDLLAGPPDLVALPDGTMVPPPDQSMPPPDLTKTVDATSGASDFAMPPIDATSGASDLAMMPMPDAVSGASDMHMVMLPDGGL
jgi:hypothetical protein